MASDSKKNKTEAAPRKEAAAKAESAPGKGAAKEAPKDAAKEPAKDAIKESAKESGKDAAKPEGGDTAAAAPANYSRGEGQKPVTAAYRENWNAIFAKKGKKKKR